MKIDTSKLHLEILDNTRQELLQKVIPATKGFVMGGGTALSLQIAHRKSYDFDFFSEKEISSTLLEKLSAHIQIKTVTYNTGDELTFFDSNDVKFTFLYYYFKPHFEIIEVSSGLNLFSINEIAVKKAYTLGRRGAYRDYFDLYTILKNNYISFDELIKATEETYAELFNAKLFLGQLVYFKDITNFDIIPVKDEQIPPPEMIKNYFEGLVSTYLIK